MIAPIALLGGLVFLARRSAKAYHDEDPTRTDDEEDSR
jgi:hypothetical protein